MNAFGYIMLLGWLPLTIILFAVMRPRRAVLIAFFGSWLFLPVVAINFYGLPPLDKIAVADYGVLLGILVFDPGVLLRYRLRWFDWPMIIWCLCPICSSLTNQLGFYNGLSTSWTHILSYGIPYFVGRLYFTDFDAMREVAIALFISGLIYIPFCVYEMRMSPQLHRIFYGVQLQSIIHSRRFGGWRPIVFMYGGIDVAMWMVAASMAGMVLWHAKVIRFIHGIPMSVYCLILGITTILTRSLGAVTLGVTIVGAYFFIRRFSARWLLIVMLAAIPVYLTLKVTVNWQAAALVDSAKIISDARAQSLEFRIQNETDMIKKAAQRFWFGWSGYGRLRVYNKHGKDTSVTDSLMIITLGRNGIVGLTAAFTALLLPLVLLVYRMPPDMWQRNATAILLVLALVVWANIVDKLINVSVPPLYGLLGGGIVTLAANLRKHRAIAVRKSIETSATT